MKRYFLTGAIALFGAVAGAATNYVDCVFTNLSTEAYASHDGSSWEKAFATIQEGVDASAEYDTVLVAKGRYETGGKTLADDGPCRVLITTKGLYLKAVAGPSQTFIVGARDTTTAVDSEGNGPNAVRCVYTSGQYTVIDGFTLADGAAHPATEKENARRADGGAFRSNATAPTLVDCVVTNCTGVRGGALRDAQAVRTLFIDNRAMVKGAAGNASQFLHCVFTRNGGSSSIVVKGVVVNCTFAVNETPYVATESTRLYNSLAVCNTQVSDGSETPTLVATNCLFTSAMTSKGKLFFATTENTLTNASPMQLLNPMLGDFRLLPTSDAVDRGEASLIGSTFKLPSAVDPWIDFSGAAIAERTGLVNGGAIQAPAPAPEGGILRFTEGAVSVDGSRELSRVFVDGLYVVADTAYRQFYVKPTPTADNMHFFRYKRSGPGVGASRNVFPRPDDTLWMMAPAKGLVFTNLVEYVSSCRYVNPKTGSDGNDGLTSASAFKTLQAAVTAVGKTKSVIRCAAGDYDSDDGLKFALGVTNRVTISSDANVRLIGAGAGKSVIWGRADAADPAGDGLGRGPAAIRCVGCSSSASAIQGFTLANGCSGYEDTGTESIDAHKGGAVFSSGAYGLIVSDSVITNCVGYRGAVYYGEYHRCRFTDSVGINGGIRYARVYSSIMDYNKPGSGNKVMLSFNSSYYHCTVIGAQADDLVAVNVPLTNSIVYRTSSTDSTWTEWGGTYAFNPNVALSYGILLDPQIAAPGAERSAANDYRILSTSPCVGGGVMDENYPAHYSPDFNGDPIVFRDGKPTVGAFQTFVQGLVVFGGNGVGFSVSGTNSLAPGETKTVTYSEAAATRPVAAMLVNGVEEAVAEGKSWSFTAPAEGAPVTTGYTLEPIFSTNWYVNANAADDSGNGFRPETAKKTFHGENGIFTTGYVESGDCVHAAKGSYDRGYVTAISLRTRVSVPSKVTLVADEGPSETFIVGADAETNPDSKGRGVDAIRCVYLPSSTALIGFTVTGGRTNDGANRDDCNGGGIYSGGGVAIDCVISNNAATRGGGMHGGVSVRCQFYDNWASANRSARSQGRSYGCIFDRNRGKTTVQNTTALENCTFGPDNLNEEGTAEATALAYPYGPILNCLIKGAVAGTTSGSQGGFTNCIFVAGKMSAMDNPTYVDICNCWTTTVENLVFESNYAPKIGENIAIDAGSRDIVNADYLADEDLFGNPRVSNRTLDIGAVEADWRPKYAEALGGEVSVTNVTEGVKLVEGRVELLDGDRLQGVWNPKVPGRRTAFSCSLAATDGTLSGTIGDRAVSTTGSETLAYREKAAVQGLDFTFTGTGAGTLSAFTQFPYGLMMLIK